MCYARHRVVSRREALERARRFNVDLVECHSNINLNKLEVVSTLFVWIKPKITKATSHLAQTFPVSYFKYSQA